MDQPKEVLPINDACGLKMSAPVCSTSRPKSPMAVHLSVRRGCTVPVAGARPCAAFAMVADCALSVMVAVGVSNMVRITGVHAPSAAVDAVAPSAKAPDSVPAFNMAILAMPCMALLPLGQMAGLIVKTSITATDNRLREVLPRRSLALAHVAMARGLTILL